MGWIVLDSDKKIVAATYAGAFHERYGEKEAINSAKADPKWFRQRRKQSDRLARLQYEATFTATYATPMLVSMLKAKGLNNVAYGFLSYNDGAVMLEIAATMFEIDLETNLTSADSEKIGRTALISH